MELDPDKVDENLDILLEVIEAYNNIEVDGDYRINYGSGDPAWSSSIEDHELYPLEYRKFAERIGYLEYSPGYLGLNVFAVPVRLGDMHEDNERGENLLREINIGHEERLTIAEWAESNGIADHLLIAENPCSYSYIVLDKSTNPFTLADLNDGMNVCDSFLEYVIVGLDFVFHQISVRPFIKKSR